MPPENEPWYSNKELFEQMQGLRQEISALRLELATLSTSMTVTRYTWKDAIAWIAVIVSVIAFWRGMKP